MMIGDAMTQFPRLTPFDPLFDPVLVFFPMLFSIEFNVTVFDVPVFDVTLLYQLKEQLHVPTTTINKIMSSKLEVYGFKVIFELTNISY